MNPFHHSKKLSLGALLSVCALFSPNPLVASADDVLLTFSTVGDSRQDPDAPDATALPLSGQDKIWLQNTKAFSRILDSVDHQKILKSVTLRR